VENNNKMTENDVRMVWVQKHIIMCWFVTFGSFLAKRPKVVIVIFFSCIDVKQQQNDRKLWVKYLGEKHSNLGFVFIFDRFLYRRYCTLVTSIFYPY